MMPHISDEEVLAPLLGALVDAKTTGEKPFRIGMAFESSGSGIRVWFDGETWPSKRWYRRLSSYTYTYQDRVLLARVGSTWVIIGKLTA